MKISITSALGFTPDQFSLIIRAHELANKVLKTEALEKIVRDTYDPRLISALLGQEPIRLTLRFYRPWNPFTSALAYTQSGIIYLNPNSLNRGTAELAGTLMHEYTHTLGYTHSFLRTKDRDSSVPYLVGNAVAKIAEILAKS